jgi:hypothetical protein
MPVVIKTGYGTMDCGALPEEAPALGDIQYLLSFNHNNILGR